MHNGATIQDPVVLLAKIDELVAQNQRLTLELDGKSRSLHQAWTKQRESDGQIAGLQAAVADAKRLLLQWDRTNEAQLAELTRLYGIEQSIPGLQSQVAALEQEVKALRDWNAATVSPRCECKTCDRLAWEASQLHQ